MGSVKTRKDKYWKTGDKEAYNRGWCGPIGTGRTIEDPLCHMLMSAREDPLWERYRTTKWTERFNQVRSSLCHWLSQFWHKRFIMEQLCGRDRGWCSLRMI